MSDLKKLVELTNVAISEAEDAGVDSAVNWARVKCLTAERCTDQDGDTMLRVWMVGADPNAHRLHSYVREYLFGRGLVVAVHSEW